jgi:prolyl 4-hydroxylase
VAAAAYRAGMTGPGESSAQHLLTFPRLQRVPSPRLELFVLRDFLPPEDCAALVDRIDARRRPSTIADANGDDYFRTSETCDLDAEDSVVAGLNARLAELSGIDPAYGEPLQGQRYEAGQEFKAHTDYFEPGGTDFDTYCSVAGQRTWTFMIYLNEVAAGGATRFKWIDKTIQPERGKLLAWNNRKSDGTVNPASLHHGMKVRAGTKYVITRWYRERPWGW